jgi:hypothetical protein
MSNVSLETVIRRVTEQVVQELAKQGIQTVSPDFRVKTERVDMRGYKTPVLLEKHVLKLHALTGIVVVPRGTVVSPKAREELRNRNILLRMEE